MPRTRAVVIIAAPLLLIAACGKGPGPAPVVTAPDAPPRAVSAPALAPAPALGPASAPAWPPLRRFSLTAPATGGPEVIELPRVTILRRAPALGRGPELLRGAPRLALFAAHVDLNGRRVGPIPYPPARAPELRHQITAAVEAARGPEYVAWSRGSGAAGESPEHTRYPIELFADAALPFGRVWEVLAATSHIEAKTCAGRTFLAAVQPSTLGGIGPHEVDLVEQLAFVCGQPAGGGPVVIVDVAVSATGLTVAGHTAAGADEAAVLAGFLAPARGRAPAKGAPVVLAVRAAADVPWARVLQVLRAHPFAAPGALVYLRPE